MSISTLLFYFIVIVPSAIIHEYAHGWMANRLGDPTAKYAGRLTLDPRSHIDIWGTVLMPIFLFVVSGGSFLFAYAKPVPFNPYNLKSHKWGPAMVALAGPMSNLLLALTFSIALRFVPFLPPVFWGIAEFISIIIFANIMLMVFNLVPIPPLDGSKILFAVLPDSAYKVRAFLEQYGMMFLLVFILFFIPYITPIISFLYYLLV